MAIDYKLVGWDTSKFVNPSSLNKMDDGIKAACDGVDALNNLAPESVTTTANTSRVTLENGAVYFYPSMNCMQISLEVVGVASGASSPIIYFNKVVRRSQALSCVDITDLSNMVVVPCYVAEHTTSTQSAIVIPFENGHRYLITGMVQT